MNRSAFCKKEKLHICRTLPKNYKFLPQTVYSRNNAQK